MHDEDFGYRDFFTGEVIGDSSKYLDWDWVLITAVQTIEDHTDKYGLLSWQVGAEDIEIDASKRIHKFQASVDRATAGSDKKAYKPQPGEYFIPDMHSRTSDPERKPTFREWLTRKPEESEEAP